MISTPAKTMLYALYFVMTAGSMVILILSFQAYGIVLSVPLFAMALIVHNLRQSRKQSSALLESQAALGYSLQKWNQVQKQGSSPAQRIGSEV